MTEQENRPAQLRTARMEAFSDGVFAVAITLLVLEITVPGGSEDDLLQAVLDQWPSYLAYVVSFATVGALWLAHTAVTDYLDHADSLLMRLNLLLLLVVSFLPFPHPAARRKHGARGRRNGRGHLLRTDAAGRHTSAERVVALRRA